MRLNGAFSDISGHIDHIRFRMGITESVVYEHTDGNRIHCHLYAFDAIYKIDTLRKVVGERFIGNGEFACAQTAKKRIPITLEGAVRYGSRNGSLHFKQVTGYAVERITEMENEWRKRKHAVPEPQQTRFQQLEEMFDAEHPDFYQELLKRAPSEDGGLNAPLTYPQWEYLKSTMRTFTFQANLQVWTPKFLNEYRMMTMTYAWRRGILINPKDKFYV